MPFNFIFQSHCNFSSLVLKLKTNTFDLSFDMNFRATILVQFLDIQSFCRFVILHYNEIVFRNMAIFFRFVKQSSVASKIINPETFFEIGTSHHIKTHSNCTHE